MTLERAANAGIWASVDLIARQAVTFVAVIFLARLLSPAEFGVFAFATFLVAFSATFISAGVTTLIVQRQDLVSEDLDRIFVALLALSALATLAVAGAGPVLAELFGLRQLASVLPIASLQILIASIAIVPTALMNKEMQLKPMAQIGLASSLLGAVVAVAAAVYGAGIWALVAQMLVTTTINSIGIWAVSTWRPKLRFDLGSLSGFMRFVLPVSFVQGLSIVHTQGFALVIAKSHPVADVGLFNRGYGVVQLPHRLFTGLIGRVALPLMSERAEDNQALQSGLQRGLAGVMVLSTPIYIGIAFLAEDLIVTLYGAQWREAWPILAILAFVGALNPIHAASVQVLLAKGMSRTFFNTELLKRLIGIGLIIAGSAFGIVGVAIAYAISLVFSTWISVLRARQVVSIGLFDQIVMLRDIWLAAIAMLGAIALFDWSVEMAPLIRLVIIPIVGAATYFATGLLLRSPIFSQLVQDVKTLAPSLKRGH